MKKTWFLALALLMVVPVVAAAESSLVRFEGGIGVTPIASVAGTQNADGSFPDVKLNVVRGKNPGGLPWVIRSLSVDVKLDGRISVDGRGLLFSGGESIGTTGNQQVRAVLFCGPSSAFTAHQSDLVPLQPNGDFRIDGVLDTLPPSPCDSPVLLIVNAGDRWFAAGIQKP